MFLISGNPTDNVPPMKIFVDVFVKKTPGKSLLMLAKQMNFIKERVLTLASNIVSDLHVST